MKSAAWKVAAAWLELATRLVIIIRCKMVLGGLTPQRSLTQFWPPKCVKIKIYHQKSIKNAFQKVDWRPASASTPQITQKQHKINKIYQLFKNWQIWNLKRGRGWFHLVWATKKQTYFPRKIHTSCFWLRWLSMECMIGISNQSAKITHYNTKLRNR